jgi:hypothetical protein
LLNVPSSSNYRKKQTPPPVSSHPMLKKRVPFSIEEVAA